MIKPTWKIIHGLKRAPLDFCSRSSDEEGKLHSDSKSSAFAKSLCREGASCSLRLKGIFRTEVKET